ncbi:hypothetical protein K2F43_06040 [Clostridium estertheticum]|uniref:hypothetical protein n=1 Tax=Clostridium estertheticum TaxID=238834 RepID=UPI001C6E33C8|nr:hypothetical protein [Clostridium estertheticum]MBW9170766.1 hypothetical protein [Clostridium estertheticum]WLC74395.1 hypothetical protein KTC99_16715 [Clostridium estertheticum]
MDYKVLKQVLNKSGQVIIKNGISINKIDSIEFDLTVNSNNKTDISHHKVDYKHCFNLQDIIKKKANKIAKKLDE